MNPKKELSKFLESYENSSEEFYQQMKRYYQSGIVTSVKLPFTPKEVKKNPLLAINYLLTYKVLSYKSPQQTSQILSILFELGPVLFHGDRVEVLILDQKFTLEVPEGKLDMDRKNEYAYTVKIKLLKSGPNRAEFENSINRDQLAQVLKDNLKSKIYVALRDILFDGFSDCPDIDLKMANLVAQPMGVVIKEPKDVEQILAAPYSTDLGLRDLEEIYVLHDLLQDENWWVFHDSEDLRIELKEIINKSRQLRIDSPIVSD